jgi:DMSO/TMAO reductase YedYZ molybdopterin-dependent catalytic subunit
MSEYSRRGLILSGAGIAGGTLIPPDSGGIYGPGETLTYAAQRLLTGTSLAREFPREKISKAPFANGKPPADKMFLEHQAKGFADWRLSIEGMVARPVSLSIDEVKKMPARSQITHLACEEGWSYIAEWIGVPLAHVLEHVGADLKAKYVVYSSPKIQRGRYDSIDMAEALHPQTFVAHGMNGGELPVAHGGPLRMRVPKHLGYKSIKFLATITVTDDLSKFGRGKGSSAADAGYSWYAGI